MLDLPHCHINCLQQVAKISKKPREGNPHTRRAEARGRSEPLGIDKLRAARDAALRTLGRTSLGPDLC